MTKIIVDGAKRERLKDTSFLRRILTKFEEIDEKKIAYEEVETVNTNIKVITIFERFEIGIAIHRATFFSERSELAIQRDVFTDEQILKAYDILRPTI